MNSSRTSGGGARLDTAAEYQTDAGAFLSVNASSKSSNGRTNGTRKRKSTPIDNSDVIKVPVLKPKYGGSVSTGRGQAAGRTTSMSHPRSTRQYPTGLALALKRQSLDPAEASWSRPKTAPEKGSGSFKPGSKPCSNWTRNKLIDVDSKVSPPTTTTATRNGSDEHSNFNTISDRPPTRSGRHQQQDDERQQYHIRKTELRLNGNNATQEQVDDMDQHSDKQRSHQPVAHVDLCDSDDDTVDDTRETKKRHSPTMLQPDSARRERTDSSVEEVEECHVPTTSGSARPRKGTAKANQDRDANPSYLAYGSTYAHNTLSSSSIPRKKQKQLDGQFASNVGQQPQREDEAFRRTGLRNDEAQCALTSNSQSTWNDESKDHAPRKRPLSPTIEQQHPRRTRATSTLGNESLENSSTVATCLVPHNSTSSYGSLKEDDTQDLSSPPRPTSSPVKTSARASSKSLFKLGNVDDLICSSEPEELPVSSRDARSYTESQLLVAPSKRNLLPGSTVRLGLSKQNGAQKKQRNDTSILGTRKQPDRQASRRPADDYSDEDNVKSNVPRQNGIDPKKFHGRNEDSHPASPTRRKSSRIKVNTQGVDTDYPEGEWDKGGSQGRSSQTRQSSRNKAKTIYEIDDSSDEDIASSSGSNYGRYSRLDSISTQRRSTRNEGKRSVDKRMLFDMEVNRIVIGKKAFNIGCSVAFSALTGQWTVAYKNGPLLAGGENHVIEGDSINLLRYYSGGTLDHAHPYFIVMEIDATTMKGFSKFKNKSTETKGAEYISVVIEFPCRGHIDEVVKALRGSREKEGANWSGFNDDSNVELSLDEVQLYAKALGLMDTTDIDSKSRPLSTRNRRKGRGTACMFDHFRKKRFLDGRKGETVLLVYPFAGDTEVIDAAAIGLTEANCAALKAESIKPNGASEPNSVEGESKTSALRDSEVAPLATMPENPPAVAANTNQRGDYVMIRVKDYDRLDPGEWLNDSLIDFWMQWMSRKEEKLTSNLHFFTSHFFTALKELGAEAVANWTSKKEIDIFTKKLVFIPVNRAGHWSLCVLINPGEIGNMYPPEPEDNVDYVDLREQKLPCILFLDSLNLHSPKMVSTSIHRWLNSEWKRLGKKQDRVPKDPFDADTFPVRSFEVPKQLNSWDCGVFVCRYAYSMLLLRHNEFTFSGASNAQGKRCTTSFKSLIKSEAFRFNLEDIARLRDEIRTLIERLSGLYLAWKADNPSQKNKESKKTTGSPVDAEVVGPRGITDDRTTEESVLLETASEANDRRKDISREEERGDDHRKPASTDSPFKPSGKPRERPDPPGCLLMDREVESSQDKARPSPNRNGETLLISSLQENLSIVQDHTSLADLEFHIQELAIENGQNENGSSPAPTRRISHRIEVEKENAWHYSAKLDDTIADPNSMVAEI